MSQTILVADITTTTLSRRVNHSVGFPIGFGGDPQKKEMHLVSKLMIDKNDDGVFLYRVSKKNEILADTWHASVEDALAQAEYEYGEVICDWHEATREEAISILKK